MKFRYIDKGKKDILVLIPGWASDYRIFAPLNLDFNYLLPQEFSPYTFAQGLLEALKRYNIKKISLFGWSLGGFLASEFAAKYASLIDELILVSIRKRYKREILAEIKKCLSKNKKGYLYKFYVQCFFQKKQMHWFKENLLKEYCEKLELNYLFQSLDYLENTDIKPEQLNNIKRVKIIHGENDCIAPVQEAMDIKNSLPQAKLIRIKDTGHIPFLRENFDGYV